MDISFIVPVYNAEKYLKTCIESILEQKMETYEIVLINDGSTDSSGKICEDYAEQFNNVVYLEQENSGLSVSRNKGMHFAKGEYIFFVDSDDKLNSILWNSVLEILHNSQPDMVGFNAVRVDEKNNIMQEKLSAFCCQTEEVISGSTLIEKYGYKRVQPMSWLYLFRRQFLIDNAITFHEGCFHEDCEFCLKSICRSEKIIYINKLFYIQRLAPNSIIRSINIKKAHDLILIANEVLEFVKKFDCNSKVQNELLNYVAYLNLAALRTCESQGGELNKFIEENPSIIKAFRNSKKYLVLHYCLKFKCYWLIKLIVYLSEKKLRMVGE